MRNNNVEKYKVFRGKKKFKKVIKDSLGKRMKQYEYTYRDYLDTGYVKNPVMIRLDGKAFHTFTKSFEKPFDDLLKKTMIDTSKQLLHEVQGCKLVYTQSDEISLLLTHHEAVNTHLLYGGNIQKIVSILASTVTLFFNINFRKNLEILEKSGCSNIARLEKYKTKVDKALFDARVWCLPFNEVTNYFIWRQQDCVKNAVQMVAQSEFSHKDLKFKNTLQLKEKLKLEKGIVIDDFSRDYIYGSIIEKVNILKINKDTGVEYTRREINVVKETPLIQENRYIVEKYIGGK